MLSTFWSTFWSNTVWYILLFVMSIITNVFILYKTKNKKFEIAFLFSIIGFAFALEAILVLVLNAYSYHPKIFEDPYLDIIVGNYFSQISLSSTALLLIVYDLSYLWYGIFAFIYFVIDFLFAKYGLFEHFWFKSSYTLIGFAPFFWLIKKWHMKAKTAANRFINYISLYFSVASFSTFVIFLPQRLLGIQLLQTNIFFTDMNRNNTSSGFVYQLIVLNYLILLHKFHMSRLAKAIAFSSLFIAQYFIYTWGYIYIFKGLFLMVTSFDLLGCYLLVVIFNYLFSEQSFTRCD
ncbi:MAG TPA: hypothetical protein VFF14_11285 [Candidatus Deferrimicrobium sp.]|nr:hypothetical protein [Candidatus Deferrimicrobium sp.]